MNHPKSFSDAVELRQHAEQRLQNRVRLPVEEAETMSPELMQILIHELRVHQIELELQNEELRRTQAELDKTRSRYFDLYDLAPVGYCTLNEHGLILEGNLAACHLLGIARSSMPMTPFSRFVANEDQDEFYLHRHRLLTTGHPQTCELRLRRKDGTIVWVQLVSSVTQGTEVDFLYRTALTDITAIKTLESALRTSEEFHLSIFDSLSEHVAVLDENGIIIAVNEAWRRFSLDNGGSSQAIAPIGVNYLQMCGRAGTETGCANSAQLHRAMQAILDGHQSEFTLEYPCHTQNQKRWFHVQVTRMLGPRPGLVVSHLNVTNRKMAEMALEESRRELVLVANHVPGPVARIDRDLRYLFANNHYEKFFGKTLDQVIGHRMPDVLGADLFQRVETHVVSALAGEQVTFESTFPSSNGMVGHTLVNYVPDRDSDDNVIGFFVLAIDITERKQAEEARNAALKILQKVTNRVPGAVYQFRLRPDGHVSMPYSNEGLYPLLGISPDDVREDASEIFVNAHPEDIDGLMASIQQSAREITHWTHECRFLINGTQKWLAGNSTPEREPDGSILWHGFITDITERKAAEATRESLESQLRESQKMEAIGTLAGGIAHDFNNALAAILGNLELAQKEIPGNESLALYLGEIHRSGIRARNLVQQILSYCRQQPTELRRLSLAAAVQNTMAMLKATVPVRFSLQVTCADEPYWIIADGTQIEQVLINLVTNAVQACGSRSGTITVTVESLCADELQRTDACPPVSEQIQDSGSVVRLTVTDDGPGIAREIRDRIFEPFFTTKPLGEGTGLGLSVVQGIVKSHGGSITVDSEPGQGTVFTIDFPAVTGESGEPFTEADSSISSLTSAALSTDAAPGEFTERHVLLIDDDRSVLSILKRMLEYSGYTVSAFSDPCFAIEALRMDPAAFHLVITDYNMPVMPGLEVAAVVRQLSPNVPIAVSSGFLDDQLRASATQLGVAELISKPFTATELSAMLDRVFRSLRHSA